MGSSVQGKTAKSSLSVTGTSMASGGVYDKVRIVGEGSIDGDVECASFKCVGNLDMSGHLATGQMSVVGTSTFSGNVQAELLKITGTVSVGGDASLKQLRCSGTLETQGSLSGEEIKLRGQLQIKGDCEADVFRARGVFEVGGLLNAGRMDIKLYETCRAREIGGETILVRRAALLAPFSFFFRPSAFSRLEADVIEGDSIYLEHTKAGIVRGKQVTIGQGCEIGLVEYKDRLEQKKGSHIADSRKL